jgi:hypothetical protein
VRCGRIHYDEDLKLLWFIGYVLLTVGAQAVSVISVIIRRNPALILFVQFQKKVFQIGPMNSYLHLYYKVRAMDFILFVHICSILNNSVSLYSILDIMSRMISLEMNPSDSSLLGMAVEFPSFMTSKESLSFNKDLPLDSVLIQVYTNYILRIYFC